MFTEYLFYGLCGIAGGILGGMGMGGGTVLIPLLSILCGVPQHTAQAINLISFIPMSAVALIIHIKNKLIDFRGIMTVIIPGCIAAVIGSFAARAISAEILKRCFGGFLIALSAFQIYSGVIKGKTKEKEIAQEKGSLKPRLKQKAR